MGIKGTKNWNSSKGHLCLTFNSGDKGSQFENGGTFGRGDLNAKNGMGHMVQEQSDCDSKRDNSPDKGDADRNSGLVRRRAGVCLETFISHHSSENQIREASFRPQCVESRAQPMVKILHRCIGDIVGSSGGTEQAKVVISRATLGLIQVGHTREEASGF